MQNFWIDGVLVLRPFFIKLFFFFKFADCVFDQLTVFYLRVFLQHLVVEFVKQFLVGFVNVFCMSILTTTPHSLALVTMISFPSLLQGLNYWICAKCGLIILKIARSLVRWREFSISASSCFLLFILV